MPEDSSQQAFHAERQACDSSLGNWTWSTGGVVTFANDHTMLYNGQPSGQWEGTAEEQGAATVRWAAGFVDRIRVSGDQISGVSQQNVRFSANRR
ncbi:MAG TPA: hypothetical protein VH763_17785 [Gemmatimonadales bacterium]|jgi:hypothetical protein